MDPHPLPEDLKESLTRVIEGETEPNDDMLVTELLRTREDQRAQLRQQLEMDALLRLEAEPTAEAFVEAVFDRTKSTADDGAFLQRVKKALPGSTDASKVARALSGWLHWRPIAAAVTGLVVGMLCTSVVLAYAAPSLGKVVTLLRDGFEKGPAPTVTGPPREIGKWSGDFTEIVGGQQDVLPSSGTKMLRFLRADYEGKRNPGRSFLSDVYRLVDIRSYRKQFGDGGAVAQLSGEFNALSFAQSEKYDCCVSIYALDAKTAEELQERENSNKERVWLVDPDVVAMTKSIALARNRRADMDRDPKTWQPVSAELRVPMNTDFLLLHFSVGYAEPSQHRINFSGHYLDNIQLTLERRAPMP
jgi:hypothetical protein